jgi:small neutral amino acid transporter SnatA (MarC family)
MIHYLVGFGLLLHVWFWGAGAALLMMPRRWRRFWPVLVIPAGLALQSAVVWAGSHTSLPGTNAYAWGAEFLPIVLLALGLYRRGWRNVNWEVRRFGVVWAAVAGGLVLLILPLAFASRGLTTISLGSNDAADYAAGARVLMEFSRLDRTGFIGLTEVVRVHSVDNFFDYWLRLNHFTPAALMAFNGTILQCSPHETVSLITMVLLAGSVPLVFWVSRAVIGYNSGASVVIAAIYGICPVTWYAVAHVAPGQLLAAQAIALITWAGVALWRGRLTWAAGAQLSGVLALAYWLLLGSYNFMVLLCLVPAVAYAGGLALADGQWARFGRWLGMMLLPLVGCAILFAGRVAGLLERFRLLREYDFGWPIPVLGPEGWLGMVRGPDLRAWEWGGVRWFLAAVVLAVLGWALIRGWRQGRRATWIVAALATPILVGYAYLEVRAVQLGTNASYDAYKLFAVFFALLLPAFCWWVTLRRSQRLYEWMGVAAAAAVVIAFNVVGCGMFIWKMSRPPLIVDGELRQLRRIEAMADVKSVNLMIPDMWSRLWANVFLLRKPQYFLTHTYEGRRNTPLRGEWDLEGGLVKHDWPEGARRQVTPRFALLDTRQPGFARGFIDERIDRNWNPEEFVPGTSERWRWTSGQATLQVQNPHAHAVTLVPQLDGWSPVPRELIFQRVGGKLPAASTVNNQRAVRALPAIEVPPGNSTFVLQTDPPAAPVDGDPRRLGLCVFRIILKPAP